MLKAVHPTCPETTSLYQNADTIACRHVPPFPHFGTRFSHVYRVTNLLLFGYSKSSYTSEAHPSSRQQEITQWTHICLLVARRIILQHVDLPNNTYYHRGQEGPSAVWGMT